MSGDVDGDTVPSDDRALLEAVRGGSATAVEELWRRHRVAARGYASSLTRRFDPEDLTSEAFTRVLSTLRNGGGPTDAFRPYLFVAIRNVAITWARTPMSHSWEDIDQTAYDPMIDSALVDSANRDKLKKALDSLPEQWRQILWATEVEGLRPSALAAQLGLTPNGVAALAYRAREALKQAWVQVHVADDLASGEHRWVRERTGRYVCRSLTARQRERVRAHLDDCTSCARVVSDAEHLAVLPIGAIGILLPVADSAMRVAGAAGAGASTVAAPVAGRMRRIPGRRSLITVGTASLVAGLVTVGAFALVPRSVPPTASFAPSPSAEADATTGSSPGSPGGVASPAEADPPIAPEDQERPPSSAIDHGESPPQPQATPERPLPPHPAPLVSADEPVLTPTPTPSQRPPMTFTLASIRAGASGVATVEITNEGPPLYQRSDATRGSIAVFHAPEGLTFAPQSSLRNFYQRAGSARSASALAFTECSREDDARTLRCIIGAAGSDGSTAREWVWRSGDTRWIYVDVTVDPSARQGSLTGAARMTLRADDGSDEVFDRAWSVDVLAAQDGSELNVDMIDPAAAEPVIGGVGPAGCRVTIARYGSAWGTTSVGDAGRWQLAVPWDAHGTYVAEAECAAPDLSG